MQAEVAAKVDANTTEAEPGEAPSAEFDLARRNSARTQMPNFPSLLYVAQVRALADLHDARWPAAALLHVHC